MVYVRFQSPTPGRRGVHPGVFGLTNTLAKHGRLSDLERAEWRAANDWYDAAYPNPSASDPTVFDEAINPRATSWFKESAAHLLERLPDYLEILRTHGVECVRVEADDPGRIVYEDEVQVVVVPHDPGAATSYHPVPPLGLEPRLRRF